MQPLSTEEQRFINTSDNVNVAKLHISDFEFILTKKEATKKIHNKELPALEFSLTLNDDHMSQLSNINEGYVTLDGKRINQLLDIRVN